MAVLSPGALVGRYQVERVLGRGGMGVVYLARHVDLERLAAVKVIAPELAADPAFRERFEREAKAAASVEHPGVLPVYEAGLRDGVLFVATRYAQGGDLRRAIAEQGPLDSDVAVEIVSQIAAALDAAHARGLLHRDVKTANILLEGELGRDVRAYLADFGLVRRTASQTQAATGSFLGTIDYVAPEQLKGDSVDIRADVYSLGCVLFELLTGHPPYRRDNDVATLWAHIAEPPPALPGHVEQAAALDAVVARALAKNPADRFPTAGALATAAGAALGDQAAALQATLRTPPATDGPTASPLSRDRLPALAYVVLACSMGLVLPVGSYDLTPDQLEVSYSRIAPQFWLFVVLYLVAQGLLLTHAYLLRRALHHRRPGLAVELMHRALVLGVGLLVVALVLHVLPTFRIAESGDPQPLKLLYDVGVFVELLALVVVAVALGAAAVASWQGGASRLAVWSAAPLAPLGLGAAASVLADPEKVLLVDLVSAGLIVWVLVSALTVLPSPELLDQERPGERYRTRRVRAGLILMGGISLMPILHSLDTAEPFDRVVALEVAIGVASLGLAVLVWRGSRRAAFALIVLQLALALRVFRPVVWWLDGATMPSAAWMSVWMDAGVGGLVSALALVLVLPTVSGRGLSARLRSASPTRRAPARPIVPPRSANETPRGSGRSG